MNRRRDHATVREKLTQQTGDMSLALGMDWSRRRTHKDVAVWRVWDQPVPRPNARD